MPVSKLFYLLTIQYIAEFSISGIKLTRGIEKEKNIIIPCEKPEAFVICHISKLNDFLLIAIYRNDFIRPGAGNVCSFTDRSNVIEQYCR